MTETPCAQTVCDTPTAPDSRFCPDHEAQFADPWMETP